MLKWITEKGEEELNQLSVLLKNKSMKRIKEKLLAMKSQPKKKVVIRNMKIQKSSEKLEKPVKQYLISKIYLIFIGNINKEDGVPKKKKSKSKNSESKKKPISLIVHTQPKPNLPATPWDESEKPNSSNFEAKLSWIPPSTTPNHDDNIFVFQNVSFLLKK